MGKRSAPARRGNKPSTSSVSNACVSSGGGIEVYGENRNSLAAAAASALRRHWLLLILIASTYLILKNLDSAFFWCDESHVAVGARDFLQTGKLTGWNGRNLNGFDNGKAVDQNLRLVNSPLDFLATAASFRIFGQSVWAARLPFALLGIASIWIFSRLVRLESGGDDLFTVLAVVLFAFSAAYLLYVRQARYYSLSVFSSLLVYQGHAMWAFHGRARMGAAVVAVGSIVAFYANPLICVLLLGALVIAHLACSGFRLRKQQWSCATGAALVFIFACAPYALKYRIWVRPDHAQVIRSWFLMRAILLKINFRDVVWTSTLSWLVLPFTIAYLFRSRESTDAVAKFTRFSLVLCFCCLLLLVLLTPQPPNINVCADVRYHVAILPPLACLAAAGIRWLWRLHAGAGAALLAVALCCNPWTFHPDHPRFQWLLPAYVKEIHSAYSTAAREVTDYLDANAKRDETLFSTPEYMNYGVNFLLKDKLLLAGILDSESHLSKEVVMKLPAYIQLGQVWPDWIVQYGQTEYSNFEAEQFLNPKSGAGSTPPPSYALVKTIARNYRETQRPELTDHWFGPLPVTKEEEQVFIYRRARGSK